MDSRYAFEEESGYKKSKQHINISINNVFSVTEQHGLNDDKKEGNSISFKKDYEKQCSYKNRIADREQLHNWGRLLIYHSLLSTKFIFILL